MFRAHEPRNCSTHKHSWYLHWDGGLYRAQCLWRTEFVPGLRIVGFNLSDSKLESLGRVRLKLLFNFDTLKIATLLFVLCKHWKQTQYKYMLTSKQDVNYLDINYKNFNDAFTFSFFLL